MQDINVQAKTKGHTRATENIQIDAEVSKGVMLAFTAIPTLIGIWSLACFAGGMIGSGSPIAMLRGFVTAITGL